MTSRMAPRALSGVLAVSTLGCDPIYTTLHRQPLAPVPDAGCLASALRASPLLVHVTPDSSGRDTRVLARFAVAVRDDETAGGHWNGEVAERAEPDGSTWATVSYSYPGFAQPTDAQRARWDGQSRAILEAVRQACAPGAPRAVECRSLGFLGGNRRACRSAV